MVTSSLQLIPELPKLENVGVEHVTELGMIVEGVGWADGHVSSLGDLSPPRKFSEIDVGFYRYEKI